MGRKFLFENFLEIVFVSAFALCVEVGKLLPGTLLARKDHVNLNQTFGRFDCTANRLLRFDFFFIGCGDETGPLPL
jgi:hypothetical protein